MGAIDGVPLLLTAAEVIVRNAEERFSETCKLLEDGAQTTFVNNLRVVTVEIEVAAVGILSLFEARMQHHLPDGSFFTKLRERLATDGQLDLANKLHQYYLAVNVLKHGRGTSYNRLRKIPNLSFVVKGPEDAFFDEGDISEPGGLVDVRAADFFYGLIETLQRAYDYLEGD